MSQGTKTIYISRCDVCGHEKSSEERSPAKNKSLFAVIEIEGKDYDFCNHCFDKIGPFLEFLKEVVEVSFEFRLVKNEPN